MNPITEDILMHYGMPKRSGRYPWGSGDSPYQHSGDFASRVQELRKSGMAEKDIAKAVGLNSTTELRVSYRIAKNERRSLELARIKSLQEDGHNNSEIAKMMGYNSESSVRSLLNEHSEARMNEAKKTAEFLKKQVDERGMVDVGIGVEREIGVSSTKMQEALKTLELEGYEVYGGRIPQVTNPGKQTTQKVLCPPGTDHKEIFDYENVHSITDFRTRDGGETFDKAFVYPESMSSKRLKIRYGDEGGSEKDGVVELRRSVKDLDLGESHYAQVRILVDGTHYIKGMAMYGDDIPDGVDLVFNTNKKSGTPVLGPKDNTVLKPITNDKSNPFGSLIKENGGQSYYEGADGKRRLSLINKRAEEGDWNDWDDALPSQFLAKQSYATAKKQINLSIADKQAEYDEICSLTNPTVKRNRLKAFADDCDSTAIHLDAAALPRQRWHVILPVTSMKETEVYAPNYSNGEKVALVRYPHGGTFEIPILTVNNKQSAARRLLGNALDAVGINNEVAKRLSGADFDGDTVMLIPTHDKAGKVKIASRPQLDGLKDFDPKMEYPSRPGSARMKNTQTEMGVISNLITDMTIKGAKDSEIARAVKHSMVVIDAEKHGLDYKKSYEDNGIDALKREYQKHDFDDKYGGASTLISRAKSQESVPQRKGQPKTDPDTGELTYKNSERTKVKTRKDGSTYEELVTVPSTKMAEAKDARSLSTGMPIEELYAGYANKMKAMANQARKEELVTGKIVYSASAKGTYQEEVDHLKAQLNVAKKNAPREREAQRIANVSVKAKKMDNPGMQKKEIKKASQQELTAARKAVGAKRSPVIISDREWEAIQAGAITDSLLSDILIFADPKRVRELSTPRASTTLSQAKIAKIKAMNASNYTIAQIADDLGVSTSTISNYLNK
ncbi:MAG: helix-turn-helix domain-containing protein [Clostridia bacterium]